MKIEKIIAISLLFTILMTGIIGLNNTVYGAKIDLLSNDRAPRFATVKNEKDLIVDISENAEIKDLTIDGLDEEFLLISEDKKTVTILEEAFENESTIDFRISSSDDDDFSNEAFADYVITKLNKPDSDGNNYKVNTGPRFTIDYTSDYDLEKVKFSFVDNSGIKSVKIKDLNSSNMVLSKSINNLKEKNYTLDLSKCSIKNDRIHLMVLTEDKKGLNRKEEVYIIIDIADEDETTEEVTKSEDTVDKNSPEYKIPKAAKSVGNYLVKNKYKYKNTRYADYKFPIQNYSSFKYLSCSSYIQQVLYEAGYKQFKGKEKLHANHKNVKKVLKDLTSNNLDARLLKTSNKKIAEELKPGDILEKNDYTHLALVYAVNGNRVTIYQVIRSGFNKKTKSLNTVRKKYYAIRITE